MNLFKAPLPYKKSNALYAILCLAAFWLNIGIADETHVEEEFSANVDTTSPVTLKPAQPLPKAESVDLEQPIVEPAENIDLEQPSPAPSTRQAPTASNAPQAIQADSLVILGKEVQPGISTRLSWSPSQSFEGIATPTPVLIAHGSKPGPVLCLTAAIHGDELNGIEIVRRVLYNIKPDKLWGTIIGVPIVNLQGFHRASRYLTDRRDLNRYFPGNSTGSSASRIAFSFFNHVIKHCDALVDLHTGSFYRTNLPQLRADLTDPKVVELTHGFGATVVLHSEGAEGTLRHAAVKAGIPAVTLEAGGPMQLQESAVEHGVKGIQTLLNRLGIYKKISLWGDPEPVYYQSIWIRANQGGILFSEVKLGERVKPKQVLGVITNPITNIKTELVAPQHGRILGMAINQVVQPGFAAFRIGIQKEEDNLVPDGNLPEQDNGPSSPLSPEPPEEEPDLAKLDTLPEEADLAGHEDSE